MVTVSLPAPIAIALVVEPINTLSAPEPPVTATVVANAVPNAIPPELVETTDVRAASA